MSDLSFLIFVKSMRGFVFQPLMNIFLTHIHGVSFVLQNVGLAILVILFTVVMMILLKLFLNL